MRQVELLHGAATDVGRVRQVNEDAYLVAPPVFVVADGMGGHADGSVASRIVVEEFGRLATTGYDATRGPDTVAEVLQVCQDRITSHPVDPSVPLGRSPGTTVVAALLVEDAGAAAWLLVNLGDSRIYRVSRGRLQQVSSDHSVVQELIDAGQLRPEDAAQHPDRHVITRALGGPRLEEADYFVLPLAGADRLLLCSDGISGLVDDEEIAQVLAAHPDPQEAAGALVAAALVAGGDDNATAVVVDVVGWEPEQRTSGDGGA